MAQLWRQPTIVSLFWYVSSVVHFEESKRRNQRNSKLKSKCPAFTFSFQADFPTCLVYWKGFVHPSSHSFRCLCPGLLPRKRRSRKSGGEWNAESYSLLEIETRHTSVTDVLPGNRTHRSLWCGIVCGDFLQRYRVCRSLFSSSIKKKLSGKEESTSSVLHERSRIAKWRIHRRTNEWMNEWTIQ